MSDVSRETQQRLECFVELLKKWNERINLVSSKDIPTLWERHIHDCARLTPHIAPGARVIDLGSGGGFPAIVIGIMRGAQLDMVESDHRKAAFLREAARVCGVRARVFTQRVETCALEPAPYITARALACLDQLCAYAAPLLAPGGKAYFMKGKNYSDELTDAARNWHMSYKIIASHAPHEGVLLEVSDIKRVE